jgi:hypothetical protein
MMPEEWPIAAPVMDRNSPARGAGRGRLSTVRADFFLNPDERLTEQERALMTAMLHCLVGDLGDELRALLPPGWVAANDEDNAALVAALTRAALLDDPALMALLLRRADEERIGSAARARGGRREARALQGLVSHHEGPVAAAAMALILARGRRRDRFGQCLVGFDDLPPETAEALVQAIAAVLRAEVAGGRGAAAADHEIAGAAARLLSRHDPSRSIDALVASLVRLLDEAGALSDELTIAAGQEGEVGFLAEVLGRRAGVPATLALDELLSGDAPRAMALLRIAGFSRDLSAGLLAGVGDLLGIADPGAAIGVFDSMTDDQLGAARSWLTSSPAYRAALEALGNGRG